MATSDDRRKRAGWQEGDLLRASPPGVQQASPSPARERSAYTNRLFESGGTSTRRTLARGSSEADRVQNAGQGLRRETQDLLNAMQRGTVNSSAFDSAGLSQADPLSEEQRRAVSRFTRPSSTPSLRGLSGAQADAVYRERLRQQRYDSGDLSAANPGQLRSLRQAYGANSEAALRSSIAGIGGRMDEVVRQNRMTDEQRLAEGQAFAGARQADSEALRAGWEAQHGIRQSDDAVQLEAQGLEQRGQIAQQESADRRYVADQNLQGQGLRAEATLQAANLRNQPNTAERAAAREDQGRQILDSMGLTSKAKAKALGTKDPEEQARTMGNHFNAMIRNTDWEALPEALQDEQVLMNLAALDASFSEQERGKWFGGGKSGRAVSYNELFDRMQDFVLGGETARIFGASTVRSGGGEFKIGNLTSQQQKIYREFATSVRDAILADDSAAGRQQQLQLAENEAREEQKKIEGLLGANFWRTSGVGRGARRSMTEGEELTPLEVDSAVYRLMKEDGVEFDSGDRGVAEASASSRREQHAMIARSSPRYEAYRQEAERLINLYEIVSSNDPEAYLSYIMAQRSGTAERQERVYGLR